MRIPRYWAHSSSTTGLPYEMSTWGWSSVSEADAKHVAEQRAQRIVEAMKSGNMPDSYEYGELPLHEPILETIGPESDPVALITRNSYFAKILNTARVCFVDIDVVDENEAAPVVEPLGFLAQFSRKKRAEHQRKINEAGQSRFIEAIMRIKKWHADHPQHAFRVYRTRAGLRLLFDDRLYDPKSDEVDGILAGLESDPLYRRLTRRQECFRARLTPKPWRIGPNQWMRDYEERSRKYNVCSFLESLGQPRDEPEIKQVIAVHDQYCCRGGDLPLA